MATDIRPPAESPGLIRGQTDRASARTAPSGTGRLVSLDVFRGFTMFWIVGGAATVLAGLAPFDHNPIAHLLIRELNHTPWFGLGFFDCIWPSFMLMVGVSIPLAFAKRSQTQSYRLQLAHAIKRAVIIFLLGSVRETINYRHPFLIEMSSALQPIAIAYLVGFLVSRRSWRFQAALAGAILAVYGLVLAFVPAPGIPAGTYEVNHNLVHYVDIAVLGMYHWNVWLPRYQAAGWGTLMVLFPPIATTLFGLIIGELLLTSRSLVNKAKIIGAMGVTLLILGFGLSPVMPIEMKMWTSTYGLASAGVACLEFLFFFWLVDIVRLRKWGIIFVPFGMNAIFIYMLTSVISINNGTNVFTGPIAKHLGSGGPFFEELVALLVVWLILYWMMKRKIFVKP